jgi:hypothetical protein
MHKQLTQIAIAALADTEESGVSADRVLSRDKSQPGGELTTLPEG